MKGAAAKLAAEKGRTMEQFQQVCGVVRLKVAQVALANLCLSANDSRRRRWRRLGGRPDAVRRGGRNRGPHHEDEGRHHRPCRQGPTRSRSRDRDRGRSRCEARRPRRDRQGQRRRCTISSGPASACGRRSRRAWSHRRANAQNLSAFSRIGRSAPRPTPSTREGRLLQRPARLWTWDEDSRRTSGYGVAKVDRRVCLARLPRPGTQGKT